MIFLLLFSLVLGDKHTNFVAAHAQALEQVLTTADRKFVPGLVSVVLGTHKSPSHLITTLKRMLVDIRQHYEMFEVIVYDDNPLRCLTFADFERLSWTSDLHDNVLDRVQYHCVSPTTLTWGQKLQYASKMHARGQYITPWTEDDVFGPGRLSRCIEQLNNGASLVGLSYVHVLYVPTNQDRRGGDKRDLAPLWRVSVNASAHAAPLTPSRPRLYVVRQPYKFEGALDTIMWNRHTLENVSYAFDPAERSLTRLMRQLKRTLLTAHRLDYFDVLDDWLLLLFDATAGDGVTVTSAGEGADEADESARVPFQLADCNPVPMLVTAHPFPNNFKPLTTHVTGPYWIDAALMHGMMRFYGLADYPSLALDYVGHHTCQSRACADEVVTHAQIAAVAKALKMRHYNWLPKLS